MITGFENITFKLTEEELRLAKNMAIGLANRVGVEQAITSKKMIKAYGETYGLILSDARIRKIINYLRLNKIVPRLVASSKGYYVATSLKDLERYKKSLIGRVSVEMALIQNVDDDITNLRNGK
jgi:hypothetical protein